MKTRAWGATTLLAAALSTTAAADWITLNVPDAPAAGYSIQGRGFDPASWVWITIEDLTDGSKPVDGPNAFQPDATGAFDIQGVTGLTCGHSFVAKSWVNDAVSATSAIAAPRCVVTSIALTIPDAPAAGYGIQGQGFDPASWVWLTIEDQTDGSKPVDGPNAFQPDASGAFNVQDVTGLACGHTFVARAWVNDAVAATSANATPGCVTNPPAGSHTADPNANAATRAFYDFLTAASGRADRRLVVGQALRGWDNDRPIDEPVTSLTNAGLPAPKMLEVDITDFASHGQDLFRVLGDHAARGGIVGITFHANNPFTGGSVYDLGGDRDLFQLSDPANPQTDAARAWRDELDEAAGVLQQLEAIGAVVLFRPLHESNGSWFWWGQADPASFRAAWTGIYSYFTNSKGLHDLLWVFSGNREMGDAMSDPTRTYPGGELVDIVGLDVYDSDLADADPGQPGYDAMLALGKPFAFTEYGSSHGTDGALVLDNRRVIETIKQRYPLAVLASAWYSSEDQGVFDNWQISDRPEPGTLLLDPWVVTR